MVTPNSYSGPPRILPADAHDITLQTSVEAPACLTTSQFTSSCLSSSIAPVS